MSLPQSPVASQAVQSFDRRAYADWLWSRSCPLRTVERALLEVLRRRANERGECWPSLSTIAEESGMARRRVAALLAKLEAAGYVARQRRLGEDGSPTSTVYRLLWPGSNRSPNGSGNGLVIMDHYPSDHGSLPLVTDDHYPSDPGAPEFLKRNYTNRNTHRGTGKTYPHASAADADGRRGGSASPRGRQKLTAEQLRRVDQITAAYERVLKENGLEPAVVGRADRAAVVALVRQRDPSQEDVERALRIFAQAANAEESYERSRLHGLGRLQDFVGRWTALCSEAAWDE